MCDNNQFARLLQESIWKAFRNDKVTSYWIIIANFFFAVLPGISYFVYNTYINNKKPSRPSLNTLALWMFLFPLFISIFQLVSFKRLMGMKMVRTHMVGQIVSLVLAMLCLNTNILDSFKTLNIFGTYAILFLCAYAVLGAYVASGFSELHMFNAFNYVNGCKKR